MSDDVPAEVARLRNAISCELHAQLALRGETIDLAAVPEVAYAVAVRLRQAFAIEWAPRWDDDPDSRATGHNRAAKPRPAWIMRRPAGGLSRGPGSGGRGFRRAPASRRPPRSPAGAAARN